MYRIKICEVSPRAFVLQIHCPAGLYIAGGTGVYKTRNNAVRWAKYWANKLSFQSFEFKE